MQVRAFLPLPRPATMLSCLALCSAVGVITIWLGSPQGALGDVGSKNGKLSSLDRELIEKAGPAVLKYLRDNGEHTVGVLKFRVKRDAEPENFYAGAINDDMVTRLENAIILASKSSDNLQLLLDPSTEAARQGQRLSYLTPLGREKLLGIEYTLRFGEEIQKGKTDVFLTGLIAINRRDHKAMLTIEAFGKKSKDLTKVYSGEVQLDRSLLIEAGMPFSLPSLGVSDVDAAAADASVDNQNANKDMPVKITILYDKKPQALLKEPSCPCEYSVAEPKEKQELIIRLKNTSQERVGVVLLVNSQSTIMKQRGLPTAEYKRWILDPGDEEDYEGFYGDEGKLERFAILSDAESKRMMEQEELSSCNLGAFEIYVFREGKPMDNAKAAIEAEDRGLSLGLKAKPMQRQKSINEARSNIQGITMNSLGLVGINPGKQGSEKLQVVEKIKNPQLANTTIIRYYHPKMKKISE